MFRYPHHIKTYQNRRGRGRGGGKGYNPIFKINNVTTEKQSRGENEEITENSEAPKIEENNNVILPKTSIDLISSNANQINLNENMNTPSDTTALNFEDLSENSLDNISGLLVIDETVNNEEVFITYSFNID